MEYALDYSTVFYFGSVFYTELFGPLTYNQEWFFTILNTFICSTFI